MQFPLYVYKKEGPYSHGLSGTFDSKVVYSEDDLINAIKNGWHPDFSSVINGTVVFDAQEVVSEEAENFDSKVVYSEDDLQEVVSEEAENTKNVTKRGRKPKVTSEELSSGETNAEVEIEDAI